jgi:Zn-dependent protease with chaperone function
VDEWILRSLRATPVKAAIDRAVDTLLSIQFGQYLATSVFIDEKSFPDLFQILSQCSDTLGIPTPHAVARHDPYLFNAFTAGTDEYSFIYMSSALCQFYTPEEASFVIGHECGHVASEHMVYHTAAHVLTDAATRRTFGMAGFFLRLTAGLSLLAWSRRSEITADRAGLLCCGDIRTAERALLRLVTGLAAVEQVDIEDYLRRYKGMQDFHNLSGFEQMFTTHPLIPKRIEALRLFANSELYYELSRKSRPIDRSLLGREELDRQVNEIVKP